MFFSRLLCLAVLGLATLTTVNSWAADPLAAQLPSALTMLKSKGYEIGRHFDAGHGLTGWIVSREGNPNVVFTSNDGEILLLGALIDSQGKNLSQGFMDQYAGNPGLANAFDDFGKATYIAQRGERPVKRILYVVFDANCPYCSIAYKTFQKYRDIGVEFRWVPVAYLSADSATRASAILEAKDPLAALETNELNFDDAHHAGGIAPAAKASATVLAELQQNDAIMGRIGASSTPTLVWKDESGRVHDFAGLPPPEVLASALGIAVPR